MNSQNKDILQYLRRGRSITPLVALEKFGVFRLSGRVWDLRQLGHNIKTTTIEQNGKRFASYRLVKE